MLNKFIFAALLLIAGELNAGVGDWFQGDTEKSEAVPFSRHFVEPHCHRIFKDAPDHNARTTDYDFMLYASTGNFGIAFKGIDDILNVKISLEIAQHSGSKPIHCTVKQGKKLYYSSDIWMTSVNNSKTIYIVSFRECDTNLVIYKSKHKKAVTAQWALLREKPVIKS